MQYMRNHGSWLQVIYKLHWASEKGELWDLVLVFYFTFLLELVEKIKHGFSNGYNCYNIILQIVVIIQDIETIPYTISDFELIQGF